MDKINSTWNWCSIELTLTAVLYKVINSSRSTKYYSTVRIQISPLHIKVPIELTWFDLDPSISSLSLNAFMNVQHKKHGSRTLANIFCDDSFATFLYRTCHLSSNFFSSRFRWKYLFKQNDRFSGTRKL